jgi:ATP-dependent DNA helicase RecG
LAIDNGFSLLDGSYRNFSKSAFIGLSELANKSNISIKILTGSTKTAARRVTQELENGSLQILIGTHALLEDKVKFQNLV